MISYEKLWATMKEKGVSQYALIKKYGVSPGQITRMKRNESVSTHTIEVFCKILDCDVGDIMEYIAEDKEKRRLLPSLFHSSMSTVILSVPCCSNSPR